MRFNGSSLNAPNFGQWPSVDIISAQVTLITPMLGGGATAGEPDLHWPFRSSSIRGQLRWWWRAVYGPSFPSLDAMAEAEADLWGWGGAARDEAVHGAVGVRVRVEKSPGLSVIDLGGGINPALRNELKRLEIPAYAFGPMNSPKNLDGKKLLEGGAARVSLFLSNSSTLNEEQMSQVEDTFRRWVSFGALGSRSNRGFGSIASAQDSDRTEIKRLLSSIPPAQEWAKGRHAGFTRLSSGRPKSAAVIGKVETAASSAWDKAIACYQRFRKGVAPDIEPEHRGQNSHNLWPEPNAFRNEQGQYQMTPPGPVDGMPLPRAALGLPLPFSAMGFDLAAAGDEQASRLASPIHIKVIKADGGFRPLCVIFIQPELAACQVSGYPGNAVPRFDVADVPAIRMRSGEHKKLHGDTIPLTFASYLTDFAKWEEL